MLLKIISFLSYLNTFYSGTHLSLPTFQLIHCANQEERLTRIRTSSSRAEKPTSPKEYFMLIWHAIHGLKPVILTVGTPFGVAFNNILFPTSRGSLSFVVLFTLNGTLLFASKYSPFSNFWFPFSCRASSHEEASKRLKKTFNGNALFYESCFYAYFFKIITAFHSCILINGFSQAVFCLSW